MPGLTDLAAAGGGSSAAQLCQTDAGRGCGPPEQMDKRLVGQTKETLQHYLLPSQPLHNGVELQTPDWKANPILRCSHLSQPPKAECLIGERGCDRPQLHQL